MKILKTLLLLFAVVSLGFAQSPSTFQHPGIFSSQSELDFIKQTVSANNGSPLIAGYQALSNSSLGSLNYNPEPYANVIVVASGGGPEEAAFRRDAHAAYIHAIKWVVTGNSAHKDKAIQILNVWASTFERMSVDPSKPNQPTLEAGWALPIWISGAEIIKSYNNGAAGWTGVSNFNSFVNKILTYVNGPIASAPNWYISKGLALMTAGVFLNNSSHYNSGYNIIAPQIDAITTSGQIPELFRDFVHSQYVLIGLAQAAEVAHQQGNDNLFTRTNGASRPRLLLGAEAYAKSLLGTGSPNYQSASQWARKSAPYEILLSRYTQLNQDVPNVRNYVVNQNRVETGVEDHFVGWFTATHAELPGGTPPPPSCTTVNVPATVQAENYCSMSGVQTETTTDSGGGQNVGYIETNDWMGYKITVPSSGTYTVSYRVASQSGGGSIRLERLGGGAAFGTISVPSTEGWQSWTTISHSITLSAGTQDVAIVATAGGFNINWIQFSSNSTPPTGAPIGQTITLKGFNNMFVSSENGTEPMWCNREEVGDWEKFLVVDASNGKIALRSMGKYVSSENGATSGITCNRTAIGGWEAFDWVSVGSNQVALRGNNGMYICSENGTAVMRCNRATYSGWETFTFAFTSATRLGSGEEEVKNEEVSNFYPNPVTGKLNYTLPASVKEHSIEIRDFSGKILSVKAMKNNGSGNAIDFSYLKPGMYFINISGEGIKRTFKIQKQ